MILGDNPLLAHLKKRNLIQSDADLLRAFLHLGTLDEVADKMGQYNALVERFGDPWGKLLAYDTIDHEFGPFREWAPVLREALRACTEQSITHVDHPARSDHHSGGTQSAPDETKTWAKVPITPEPAKTPAAVLPDEIDLRMANVLLMRNQPDASLNGFYRLVRVASDDSSVLQLDENPFLV